MVIKKHMNKQSFEGVGSDGTGFLQLFPPLEPFLWRSGQILISSQPPKSAALQIPKITCQRQGWFRQCPNDSPSGHMQWTRDLISWETSGVWGRESTLNDGPRVGGKEPQRWDASWFLTILGVAILHTHRATHRPLPLEYMSHFPNLFPNYRC